MQKLDGLTTKTVSISKFKELITSRIKQNLGILIALTIISLWIGSLVVLFNIDISTLPTWALISAILLRVFLHTGLFITAHDAMHGTVIPHNRKVNDFIGSVAAFLYAAFIYKNFHEKHILHHRHPATEDDPDFFPENQHNPFIWYLKFLIAYLTKAQVLVLALVMTAFFHTCLRVFHVTELNLQLFWVVPSLISSVQLFYFGIFLPHREPETGYTNRHHAVSLYYSTFWSFISCYHFGYHWEHHEYPHLPWYKLPSKVESDRVCS